MTHAKGFQSHMDQHETLGEVIKNFLGMVVAALMAWFGASLTKVSRKEFDKLADEFATLKTQYSTNAAASNAELTAIKVTLVAMQRQMDESFRLVREDIHRGKERD